MTRLHPLLSVAATLVVVSGLRLGRPLLVPIALAVVVSLLLAPVVRRLERLRVPRSVGAPLVVALLAAAVGALGLVVTRQAIALGRDLPRYRQNIEDKLSSLRPAAAFVDRVQGLLRDAGDVGPALPRPGEPVRVEVVDSGPDQLTLASGLLSFAADVGRTVALALLLVIFFLVNQSDIVDRIIQLAGPGQVTITTQALYEAAHGVSRYLGAQALMNGAFGVALGTGLLALGVPNALLWGLLGGLLRFLPYVGPMIGCSLPALLAFSAFDGWSRPLGTLGFLVALELVVSNVAEPLAYGARTGLSPVALILSAVLWGWLWGPLGLLLAVPLSVCLAALGRCVPALRFLTVILGNQPPIEPPVALYHRLLAGKHAQALDLLERSRDQEPLEATFDRLLAPVLALTQADLERGALTPASATAVLESLRHLVNDLADERAAELPTPEPSGVVLCLPASDPTDAALCEMLARALSLTGHRATAETLPALTTEKAELVVEAGADVVCIVALAPANLLRLRYLYKKLRRRVPELAIVVLAWGLDDRDPGAAATVAPDGRGTITTTLVAASQAARAACQLVRR